MTAADMAKAIEPKSDQLNADDLITGPRTIKITEVAIRASTEQPVSIFFDGDNGKPWKPCKSMSRVLVAAWGPDAKNYAGRSLTLYRDPTVKWAGMEVGGIRVSHMTDIENPMTMALTATKGSRKPYTVRPLAPDTDPVADLVRDYNKCDTKERFAELETTRGKVWSSLTGTDKKTLKSASDEAASRLNDAAKE